MPGYWPEGNVCSGNYCRALRGLGKAWSQHPGACTPTPLPGLACPLLGWEGWSAQPTAALNPRAPWLGKGLVPDGTGAWPGPRGSDPTCRLPSSPAPTISPPTPMSGAHLRVMAKTQTQT